MTIPYQKPDRIFDDNHGYFDFLKPNSTQDWAFLGIVLMAIGGFIYLAVSLI